MSLDCSGIFTIFWLFIHLTFERSIKNLNKKFQLTRDRNWPVLTLIGHDQWWADQSEKSNSVPIKFTRMIAHVKHTFTQTVRSQPYTLHVVRVEVLYCEWSSQFVTVIMGTGPVAPWLFCSVLCTAPYPTRSVSEVERLVVVLNFPLFLSFLRS